MVVDCCVLFFKIFSFSIAFLSLLQGNKFTFFQNLYYFCDRNSCCKILSGCGKFLLFPNLHQISSSF